MGFPFSEKDQLEKGGKMEKESENGVVEKTDSMKEDEKETEVVLFQDLGFNVKIEAPSVEPFDLQVSERIRTNLHHVLVPRGPTLFAIRFIFNNNTWTFYYR